MTEDRYHVKLTVQIRPYGDDVTDRMRQATHEIGKLKAHVKGKKRRLRQSKKGIYIVHLRRNVNLPALRFTLARFGIVILEIKDNTPAE